MLARIPASETPARLRVLVVEDHADTADTTALLLRLCGHEAEVASDGPSALRLAEECRPDVVLLDIALPGMDGYAVARRLHDQPALKKPFLIAVTGLGRAADRRQADEAGIHLHFDKPLDFGELERILTRFQQVVGSPA